MNNSYLKHALWVIVLLIFNMTAHAQSDYSIEQLLQPCMEGDNDAREQGYIAELQCEQYIHGFIDSYVLLSSGGKADNVCLPKQNRADEVRWAFMRWTHENYGQRDQPAGEGLLTVLKEKFVCQ